MSNKQYTDFIYAKAYNQDGKFKSLNTSEDYSVVNESKVSNTKTLSELTSCSGVSGAPNWKFMVGTVTDSAPNIKVL